MNTQSAGPGNHERDGLDVIPTFHWCQVKTANPHFCAAQPAAAISSRRVCNYCIRCCSASTRAVSKYWVAVLACDNITSVNFFCWCAEKTTELNNSSPIL